MDIRISSANNSYEFTVENQNELESYDFVVPEEPETLLLDPENWILKEAQEGSVIVIDEPRNIPDRIELNSPYPNPFNGSVNISFSVSGSTEDVTIDIYDIAGRKVRGLVSGNYAPGYYIVGWDGVTDDELRPASGTYFVLMHSDYGSQTKKILYLR